jgi:hypothetical protein
MTKEEGDITFVMFFYVLNNIIGLVSGDADRYENQNTRINKTKNNCLATYSV